MPQYRFNYLTIAHQNYRKLIALYKVYYTGQHIALSLNINSPGPRKFNVRQSNKSGIEAHRGAQETYHPPFCTMWTILCNSLTAIFFYFLQKFHCQMSTSYNSVLTNLLESVLPTRNLDSIFFASSF